MNILALPLAPPTPGTPAAAPAPSGTFQDILNDCATGTPETPAAQGDDEISTVPAEDASPVSNVAPRDGGLFTQMVDANCETGLRGTDVLDSDLSQATAAPATTTTQGVVALVLSKVAEASQPKATSAATSPNPMRASISVTDSKSIANIGKAMAAREAIQADQVEALSDNVQDPAGSSNVFEIAQITAPAPAPLPASFRSDPAPLVEYTPLHLSQDGEWIGALSREIVGNAARDNQLQFRLMPELLGQLDVALTTVDGQVDIRLETSTAAAAQIIAADQARLIEDLRNAGLKLGQFEMTNSQNGNRQPQRQPAHDGQTAEDNSNQPRTPASPKARGRFA
jgi:flagellar hook-length control protein FliK